MKARWLNEYQAEQDRTAPSLPVSTPTSPPPLPTPPAARTTVAKSEYVQAAGTAKIEATGVLDEDVAMDGQERGGEVISAVASATATTVGAAAPTAVATGVVDNALAVHSAEPSPVCSWKAPPTDTDRTFPSEGVPTAGVAALPSNGGGTKPLQAECAAPVPGAPLSRDPVTPRSVVFVQKARSDNTEVGGVMDASGGGGGGVSSVSAANRGGGPFENSPQAAAVFTAEKSGLSEHVPGVKPLQGESIRGVKDGASVSSVAKLAQGGGRTVALAGTKVEEGPNLQREVFSSEQPPPASLPAQTMEAEVAPASSVAQNGAVHHSHTPSERGGTPLAKNLPASSVTAEADTSGNPAKGGREQNTEKGKGIIEGFVSPPLLSAVDHAPSRAHELSQQGLGLQLSDQKQPQDKLTLMTPLPIIHPPKSVSSAKLNPPLDPPPSAMADSPDSPDLPPHLRHLGATIAHRSVPPLLPSPSFQQAHPPKAHERKSSASRMVHNVDPEARAAKRKAQPSEPVLPSNPSDSESEQQPAHTGSPPNEATVRALI